MVSLRRRRLLGFCTGVLNSAIAPCPIYFDNEGVAQCSPPLAEKKQTTQVSNSSSGPGLSNASDSCLLNHHSDQPNILSSSPLQEHKSPPSPDQEVKRRKRYKRKGTNDNVMMRGVYFKNMKWQAAIKVEKRQIHLGTVESQEEAAHLYDRAAFMCGREPNFELSEEEKQELRNYNWDEFLVVTRLAISNRKVRRGHGAAGLQFKSEALAQESKFQIDPVVEVKVEQDESISGKDA